MNITEKLRAFVKVISTRGVGHTALMQTGTESYPKPFIQVGFTMSSMLQAGFDKNQNASLVTVDGLISGKAAGKDFPVAVDNHVIRELMSDALFTIECMQSSLEKKTEVMDELMNLVEYYQDRTHAIEKISFQLAVTPWYKIRKIITLEKQLHQMVLEYNTESSPVEESFQRILKIAKEDR
jgi:hypothetical protein